MICTTLAAGHTNGDNWVVFPAVGAMHTGDMFQRKNMPFIDVANNGGDALEFSQTLNGAASTIKGVQTVIPGHSPTLMSWNDFGSTPTTTPSSWQPCRARSRPEVRGRGGRRVQAVR